MGLDATVMCNCFRDGRTTEPPVPREWLYVDEDGCLAVRSEYDSDDRWVEVYQWEQTCCPHPGMDHASEHIANWSGYRLFQAALAAVGWERFPVLRAELPEANGGTTSPAAAALALSELDAFRAVGYVGTNAVLVDSTTGGVVTEHVAAYDGVFILDGRTGIDVGVGAAGFFVRDRATGADLFRATRFRQVVTQPAPREGEPPVEIEFVNPQTGNRFRSRTAVSGRAIPWSDGRMQDDDGRYRFEYPAEFHVETRPVTPGEFDDILGSLARVFRAAVETGNSVRWCWPSASIPACGLRHLASEGEYIVAAVRHLRGLGWRSSRGGWMGTREVVHLLCRPGRTARVL